MKASFKVDFSVTEKGRKAPQWKIENDLNGEMSLADLLEFTKQNLILIADTALSEEQAKGFDRTPIVKVDNRVGKPVAQVSPLGSIEFISRQNIDDIMLAIYDAIEHRSPVDTGLYKQSNYVFFNGKQIAKTRSELTAWLATKPQVEPKDLIRFVNIQPYARKLERYGVTAQRQQRRLRKSQDARARSGNGGKVLAPNGTYYLASRSASRLYKNNLKISFKYIVGSDLGLMSVFKTGSNGVPGSKKKSSRKAKNPRTYLYPSILLKITEGGLK
jgi:hypothetical protein